MNPTTALNSAIQKLNHTIATRAHLRDALAAATPADAPTLAAPTGEPGAFNLETSVERAGVYGFPGAGHTRRPYGLGTRGATTRNGYSIPFSISCNAAMRPENRAIQPVAFSPNG